MIVVAVGVFLMVAWTVGGWVIVRMGFTRDSDAASRALPHDDDGAHPAHHGPAPVDPASDPNANWREQMKAATAASGAACTCPRTSAGADAPSPEAHDPRAAVVSAAGPSTFSPSPDCPIHRWDYA
ncbi:hypothetical protein [Micrococcus endophyticus]|nr:hypothetical protein [Micrococcus endophyticus]